MNEAGTLRADFKALAEIGRDPAGGWTRPAFGSDDRRAHEWFAARATKAGLTVRSDAIGNVIARLEGTRGGPAIAIGSHLDTVISGGAFDGAIGVLAGLDVARSIAASEPDWTVPLEVIAFRDEEGRFGAFTGSRAMMGLLGDDEVARMRDVDGVRLVDALEAAGLDARSIAQARRKPDAFRAFIELHIEQGSVLERAGQSIGIVSAIAGQERLAVRFTGSPDHAGTTPMTTRRDAFAAAARFSDRFRELILAKGEDTARGTIGIVKVTPNRGNVVPDDVRLGLEIRDIRGDRLASLAATTAELAAAVAAEMNVEARVRTVFQAAPVAMDEGICAALGAAARRIEIDAKVLASGANHDAGVLATRLPAGMVFVPSRDGRSHCPEEHTDWAHVETGARLLEATVRELARGVEHG